MDYFCYISRSKVDQLFQTLGDSEVDEWTEHRTTEHAVALDAKADWNLAHVVNLFKAGISYGRKGVIQREQKVKLHYTEKLRRVLLAAAAERPIPALASALLQKELSGPYFHASGLFKVQWPVDDEAASNQVISLVTEVEGEPLVLDCSLANFSEGIQPNGRFQVNSFNARFFHEASPLPLETVFVLLARNGSGVVGTPLFLKLSGAEPVVL